jgi:DNA-binding CsgD family transcriptional regulator
MTILDTNTEACDLRGPRKSIFASFTRRLIEIAAVAGRADRAHPQLPRSMRCGCPRSHWTRLFVRDPDAQTLLKDAIDQLQTLPRLDSLTLEPVIVPCMDKLPVIVRIWPFEGPSHPPGQEVRALLTLNALGPRPGPPAANLTKTFRLTPPGAKLACIIARGAPPDIAARELKISRATARNQLNFVSRQTRIAKASWSHC